MQTHNMLTTYFNNEWTKHWENVVIKTSHMSRKVLYQNKNMTAKTAIKHANGLPTYRQYISNKPDLDLELVIQERNEDWDWYHIAIHPKMTLDIYNRMRKAELENNIEHLFSNTNIPIDEIIGNFTDMSVIAKCISRRSDFDMKYLFHPYFAHSRVSFNWCYISTHKDATMEFVEQHIDFPWEFYFMHENPNFTFDMVVRHVEKPWNLHKLSKNPSVTIDFVLKNVKKAWNWNALTRHKNTTIDVIKKHINLWNWKIIHENPNFTIQLVIQHRKKPWNWKEVSKHATMQIIAENPNMPWFIENVSDLTFDYVLQHHERNWDWTALSANESIPVETIIQNSTYSWNWFCVCSRNVIDCIIKYPNVIDNHGNNVWMNYPVIPNPKYTIDKLCKIADMSPYSSSSFARSFLKSSSGYSHIAIHTFKHKQYDWNWKAIANLTFDKEREQYVAKQITQLMLISMLRTLTTNNNYLDGNVEKVFIDNYMVKQINKFI
jgi:hypothetical protein